MHAVLAADRLQRGQLLERGLAEALVASHGVERVGEAAVLVPVGRFDGDVLAGEAVLGPRLRCQLLAAEAECVGIGAGDAPLVGDALGALELGRHLVLLEVALRDGDTEAECLAPPDTDGDAAHQFHATGEGDIDDAAADQRGGEVGGLLATAALGVDGGGRGGDGQPGAEPCGAGDVERLLADLADAAADDLIDLGRVDAGPVDDGLLDGGQHLGRVHGGQAAVALADGRADGVDDDDVAHGGSLRWRPCQASTLRSVHRTTRTNTASSTSSARRSSSTTDRVTMVGRSTSWACWVIRRAGASTCRTAKTRRTARPPTSTRTTAVPVKSIGSSPAAPCSSWSGRARIGSAVAVAPPRWRSTTNGR